MKLISVVIPCYNVEQYIDRCAAHLINQSIGIDNLELIFVNDGSSDGTFINCWNGKKNFLTQ